MFASLYLSESKRLNILVLGTDNQSFLAVIRSLGRAGYEIHVAWYVENSDALASRYIFSRHQLSPFRANDPLWLSEFLNLLASNSINLVIPCTDSVTIPLQAIHSQLSSSVKLYVLPRVLFQTANSKNAMYLIASDLGIPLPKGATVSSVEEAKLVLDVFNGPWVFKPEFSYSGESLGARNSVQKAFNRDEANQLVSRFLSRGRFQIQENFIGVGTGVEVLCDQGEILMEFQHIRIHEPLHGGGSSYRKGVPVHPGMREAMQKLMARLQYTGVAMAEFKWNQESGQWIFIELNARFWGSLPLAVASGADFPRALVELLTSGKHSMTSKIRHDLFARNLALDTEWMTANFHADKKDPTLSALPWSTVLKEGLTLVCGKERWDSLAVDDSAPFFREVIGIFRAKAKALFRTIVCTKVFLAATRMWRCRRLRQRLYLARSIGFVCHGNICRSPFAALYAQKNIGETRFFSAGFHQTEFRSPPANAINAALGFDIDLKDHRSHRLSQEDARTADILFVFDRKNLRDMHFSFPEATERTFLLSDLNRKKNQEVDDPWDHDMEFFCESYRAIQSLVHAIPKHHFPDK